MVVRDMFTNAATCLENGRLPWSLYRSCLQTLSGGNYNPETAGVFLAALVRNRIPHRVEILTAIDLLRRGGVEPLTVQGKVICTGGTGGSGGAKSFNVTSLATLLAASTSGKVRFVKYGNAGNQSSGSSTFWENALEIEASHLTVERARRTLESAGFAVIHAGTVGSGFATVRPARQAANGPTIFNLAAPLTCPVKGPKTYCAIGVFRSDLLPVYVRSMQGTLKRGICFTGRVAGRHDVDEVSLSGATEVHCANYERVKELTPWDGKSIPVIPASSRATSMRVLEKLLEGDTTSTETRLVVANAATYLAFATNTRFKVTLESAECAVRSGRLGEFLVRYCRQLKK